MNLTNELKEFANNFKNQAPIEVQQTMQKAHDELVNKKIAKDSLKVQDKVSDFKLLNQNNELKSFTELFSDNDFIVLSFYRGGWCPYCNLELKALQNYKKQFLDLKTKIVAISPERPDHSLNTSQKNELDFEVLSDIDSHVSKKFGLSFELPESLKPLYQEFKINIPEHNGENNYTLPVPATYLIDKNGNIHYAFVNLDYTLRADPQEIIALIKTIKI